MFLGSHPHSVELGLLYKMFEKSYSKKLDIKTNSNSCILFVAILFPSLLVYPFCDWFSAILSNAVVSNTLIAIDRSITKVLWVDYMI